MGLRGNTRFLGRLKEVLIKDVRIDLVNSMERNFMILDVGNSRESSRFRIPV